MQFLYVDWRWTVSFIDPSCDGSARIKLVGSLEKALELGLRLRKAGLEVRRIADPAGFEIPVEAVDCYERLKPLYTKKSYDRAAPIVSLCRASRRGR